MRFFTHWDPPRSKGETGFPPSIVDSSDYEPIADLIQRMVSGGYVPVRDGSYDDDDYDEPVGFDCVDADFSDVLPNAGADSVHSVPAEETPSDQPANDDQPSEDKGVDPAPEKSE